jgi:predicted aspartyl protease
MKPHLLALLSAFMLGVAPPPAPPAPPPSGPAPAGDDAAASDAAAKTLALEADRNERMTVPVSLGASGPYSFIVDTGAERTVIARELAVRLALGEGGKVKVHSMTEVSDIETVIIPALEVGGNELRGVHAPELDRSNLGAEGMRGIDALQSQRVSFDFKRKLMTVVPSRRIEEHWTDDAIVVVGKRLYGQLVLVDASVEGQKVMVIVDTGAQISVGNTALRHKLEHRHRLAETHPVEMLSVTGGRITADATLIKSIRLGGITIQNLPIAFADVHPFRKLQLMDRPAILLGMDALRLFDRVSVDFANRRVRLLPAGHAQWQIENHLALAPAPRAKAG